MLFPQVHTASSKQLLAEFATPEATAEILTPELPNSNAPNFRLSFPDGVCHTDTRSMQMIAPQATANSIVVLFERAHKTQLLHQVRARAKGNRENRMRRVPNLLKNSWVEFWILVTLLNKGLLGSIRLPTCGVDAQLRLFHKRSLSVLYTPSPQL